MSKTILIADDDADLIEGLRWYLEAEGLQILCALDGEAAHRGAVCCLGDCRRLGYTGGRYHPRRG